MWLVIQKTHLANQMNNDSDYPEIRQNQSQSTTPQFEYNRVATETFSRRRRRRMVHDIMRITLLAAAVALICFSLQQVWRICCCVYICVQFLPYRQAPLSQAVSIADSSSHPDIAQHGNIRVEATHTNLIINHPALVVQRAPILLHKPAALVSPHRRTVPSISSQQRRSPIGPHCRPGRPYQRPVIHRRNDANKRKQNRRGMAAKVLDESYVMWQRAPQRAIPEGEIIDVQENERNEYVIDERQLDPRRLYVQAIYYGHGDRNRTDANAPEVGHQ